jgi:hypothetical protein
VHARLSLRLVAAGALIASAAQAQATQAPQVSVTGVVYTQYQYVDFPVHNNTFDVTRSYVNVLGRFTGGLATRVTLDILPSVATSQFYRLKYAFAAWTPTGSKLTYKLGMIQTPYVDFEETLWDYRMQGSIAVDRNGKMTSSDIGAGIDGTWNNEQVNAQVAIVNGEGYSGGTGDFRKDLEGRVSVRLQPTNDPSRVGGLRVTGYAGIGKATGGADRNRFLGLLSYRTREYTLAGEYVATKDGAVDGSIISAFGVYHFPGGKNAAIARLDVYDPDTNVGANKLTRIIAGVSHQLTPNARLLADLDRVKLQGATNATNQILLQAQFTF